MEKLDLCKYMDHTLLSPEATTEKIKQLCLEAIEYGFAAVCVNPCHVAKAKAFLKGSSVKVCTVIGFPLGANKSEVKAYEGRLAVIDGAEEIDMVINIGKLKEVDYEYVKEDILSVVREVKEKALVKVIIETCLLSKEEIIKICEICKEAKVDFVKTSTGFSKGGATVEDVTLIKTVVKEELKIKASGGIRSLDTAKQMTKAGANRLGTSQSIKIIEESLNK